MMKELFVLYSLGSLSFGINFQLNNTCYMHPASSAPSRFRDGAELQSLLYRSQNGFAVQQGRQWAPTQRYRSVGQLGSRD